MSIEEARCHSRAQTSYTQSTLKIAGRVIETATQKEKTRKNADQELTNTVNWANMEEAVKEAGTGMQGYASTNGPIR